MDKELMKKVKEGDKEAFEQLIILHQKGALSFAGRFLKDTAEAEDIVQEAFAYLYVYSSRYDERYSLKTYLYTIIRNKCVDYMRKRRYIDSYGVDDLQSIAGFHTFADEKEKHQILYKSIDQLKNDYKAVIYLIDYEGFTYKETAKIMGKNTAQIKILVFRARKKLKGLLEEEGIFHA